MNRIRQALVILLWLYAGVIFLGLVLDKNMWLWIRAYWLILTVKNGMDWYMGRKRGG